ncbi:mitotic interactor and substrate of PLK1 [Spea bombifrons]|uniref:mitotic interactor and substrate of PLK1 n=1 Tax=Spea bombifrons TaxID=233779 RepID=UPI00234A508A|nr:mitotic interactor and substrate of PLK1 [Spea bombifrons]
MFKYPSPWQVLCSGLERREQTQSTAEDHEADAAVFLAVKIPVNEGESQSVDESSLSQLIAQDATPEQCVNGSQKHHSTTKQQIIGSPKQQEKEKHEKLNSPDLEVCGTPDTRKWNEIDLCVTGTNKVPETSEVTSYTQNNSIKETSASGQQIVSDMDRVTRNLIFSLSSSGSLDFINKESEMETNSTSEHSQSEERMGYSDVWVPPPDRERRLRILKEDNHFGVRAYLPDTSPSKLFEDGEDDSAQVNLLKFTPEKAWELEKQRRDLIKEQGQRKSLSTGEINISQDGMDSSASDIGLNEFDSDPTEMHVNTEQINFESARQQFLILEKKQNSVPISPRLQSKPSYASSQSLYESDFNPKLYGMGNSVGTSNEARTYQTETPANQEITGRIRSVGQLRKQFLWQGYVDEGDSVVVEKSQEVPGQTQLQETEQLAEHIPHPSNETPIEREIRLALEREESLRKERGIQSTVATKEMVEILKNPVISQPSETQNEKKSKERYRSSFFLQREIEKEAQREADLKGEGKVPGLYDKGSVQQIDERRKLFEQPDEIPVQPQQGVTKIDSRVMDAQGTRENLTVMDSPQPYNTRTVLQPSTLNTFRHRRQSVDEILDHNIPVKEATVEIPILNRENFHVKPWTARLRIRGDEMVEEGEKWTEITSKNPSPGEMYSITRLRPSTSNVIEQEIQQMLERDRELQEQRRKTEVHHVTTFTDSQPTTPLNGYKQYTKTSLNSGDSSPWSPAPQRGSSSSRNPSYSVTPIQMFRPRRYPRFVVSESDSAGPKGHGDNFWYAGIDPSDDVNTEIVESTRVNRHKSRMALRWEAGIYTNEPSD